MMPLFETIARRAWRTDSSFHTRAES
jgi:hypothetical protein